MRSLGEKNLLTKSMSFYLRLITLGYNQYLLSNNVPLRPKQQWRVWAVRAVASWTQTLTPLFPGWGHLAHYFTQQAQAGRVKGEVPTSTRDHACEVPLLWRSSSIPMPRVYSGYDPASGQENWPSQAVELNWGNLSISLPSGGMGTACHLSPVTGALF